MRYAQKFFNQEKQEQNMKISNEGEDQNSLAKNILNFKHMKKGQYMLHVLIETTSSLSLDYQDDIDAKIIIKAFGQKNQTKVKKNVGVEQTFWGQHFYFYQNFENSKAIEKQRVVIQVYDYNRIVSNSLVGSYDIDVMTVYMNEDHKLEHYWFGLSNIELDYSEITGYVKVSMCIIGENQNSQELKVEPISSVNVEKKIFMPPSIQRKSYQVIAQILQGKDIMPADGETIDSYIGLQFGQIFQISEPVAKDCNPNYDQRIFLPISIPAAISNIVIRINDFNFIQRGEVIGSRYINISNLIDNMAKNEKYYLQSHVAQNNFLKFSDLQWINFYGPQPEAKNKQQKNLHEFFPQLATYYVGSVLLRIRIQENSHPEKRREEISKRQRKNIFEAYPFHHIFYRIKATITAGMNLKNKKKKYKVMIKVGGDQVQTDYAECQNGFCVWATQFQFSTTIYSNQIVPDIFVYLIDHKGRKVCYYRVLASDTPGIPILEDKWISLAPDLSIVDYKREEAGYLKLGISMKREQKHRALAKRSIKNRSIQNYYDKYDGRGKLFVELICAHSLIPLDHEGTSDPFFTITFLNAEGHSSTQNNTINPNYLEVIQINTNIPKDEQLCPPIIVSAYDKDKFSKQLIGSTFLDPGDLIKSKALAFNSDRVEIIPQQFPLTQNGIICGYFIASFRMFHSYNSRRIPEIKLKSKKFKIFLLTLGLRGLKPNGIMPIRNQVVQFDFKSLVKFNKENLNLQGRLKSDQKLNSYDPLQETLYLPEDPNYWPILSGQVKNRVLGSVYEQTLGYFSLNLKQCYRRTITGGYLKKSVPSLKNTKGGIIRKTKKLQCLSDRTIIALRTFIMKATNYKWHILSDKTKLNQLNSSKSKQKTLNQQAIVIFPNYIKSYQQRKVYELDYVHRDKQIRKSLKSNKKHNKQKNIQDKTPQYLERYESRILQNQQYMIIGYDKNQMRAKTLDQRQKHYRYALNKTYQQYCQSVYGISLALVQQTKIRRGRKNYQNDVISSLVRAVSTQDMQCGIFKGNLFIADEDNKNWDSLIKIQKQLIGRIRRKSTIMMYLYIIDARNLPSKDLFSASDSFLIVKAGKKQIDLGDDYIKDDANPQYLQKVRLQLQFPSDSIVQIEVWDHDPIKDQLIGTVSIDIQNRLQGQLISQTWNNPIQTHNILNSTSRISQGLLRFWVDLVPKDLLPLYRQFDIRPKQPADFQVRVIIWQCSGIRNSDFEDMNDLYATCQFNGDVQETDVHYRTQTGEGNFNWRMKFPIRLPAKNYQMSFKIYDKDIFSGNDYLCSCSFSIEKYLREAFETDTCARLFLGTEDLAKKSDVKTGKSRIINGEKRYDRFEMDLISKNSEYSQSSSESSQNENNKLLINSGKIEVSIQILTQKQSKRRPAGKGRQNPNQNPYLPEPKNRFVMSLNPVKVLGQLCGQKFKMKICFFFILILVITTLIYFGASFGGAFAGSAAAG